MVSLRNEIIFFLIITLSFCGCFVSKDDLLSLDRAKIIKSQLKLNGYYYLKYHEGNDSHFSIYFLYKNGIVLYGGTPSFSQLEDTEEGFKTTEFYDFVTLRKYHWGVYEIEGNKIKIERWNPSKSPLKTFIHEGRILNDSTFHIDKFYWSNKKEEIKERDIKYHFKPFSPKPDSTNTFIK